MFQAIATVLAWFYDITNNYALSIGLLTLIVMILLTPLTVKSTRSMLQMQRLQPEIKRIQGEFKGDRQRLNEELMKFYQENKINPLGGCLPLLLQAPVFIVLYRLIFHLTQKCTAEAVAAANQKGSGRCRAIIPGNFGPSYLDRASNLWKDLSSSNTMKSFGIDLAKPTITKIQEGIGGAIPFLIILLIVAFTSWYSQKQIMNRSTGQSAVNPQQQAIMKFIPFLWPITLGVFPIPVAMAIYGLVQNIFRIAQNAVITHKIYKPHLEEHSRMQATAGEGDAGKDAKPKSSEPKPRPLPPKAKGRELPETPKKDRPAPNRPASDRSGTGGVKPKPKPKPTGGKDPGH